MYKSYWKLAYKYKTKLFCRNCNQYYDINYNINSLYKVHMNSVIIFK